MFIRKLEIPPGAPWDQWRAAKLEAAHGAPLPTEEAALSVKRLRHWAPHSVGLFAVAYIRRADDLPAELSAVVDGLTVRFRFAAPRLRQATLKRQAIALASLVFAAVSLGLAGQKALEARAANEALLQREEAHAQRWGAAARQRRRDAEEQRLIRQAGAEGRGFGDLAADLVWLGRAKAPSVAFERVRWTAGEMQVLVQGPGAPLLTPERPLTPIDQIAGLQAWRIGERARPVVKAGVVRPSVVEDKPRLLAAPSERGP